VRLFVAIDLDEPLRRAVSDAAHRVRRNFERAAGGARVSWTAADRMHITLHFLGDVESPGASALADAFGNPILVQPFTLEIGAPGTFPSSGRPRVLWLGVRAKHEALSAIHRVTGERLESVGFAVDPAPFNPHLTIGRVRSPVRAATTAAAFDGAPRRIGTCRVDAVRLYESRLGGPHPSYVVVASAPLTGPPD
jgi:2'-5' RNA ligase